MIALELLLVLASAPAYDVSSWDLSPGSIPRLSASGDSPAGFPVISGGGILTDPAQVSGSITNVCLHSEDIVSGTSLVSPWASYKQGTGVTLTFSTVSDVGPDGVIKDISRFSFSAVAIGNWADVYQANGTYAAGQYTWSFWARKVSGDGNEISCRLYAANPSGLQIVTLTDQWQRFSGTGTATGAANATSPTIGWVSAAAPHGAIVVDISDVQVEAVGNLSTPGPYVATATTSAGGVRGEYTGRPSDPGILVPVQVSDPRTWGVGISTSKVSWAGADAIVDLGGQLSGYRWNSARLETTAGGALVFTVIDSTGASATRTVAAHGFADGSTHKLAFGAFDGTPILLVDGISSGTLSGAAVLSSFPSTIGINSTVHPVAKTVYRVSQGPTPWAAHRKLK